MGASYLAPVGQGFLLPLVACTTTFIFARLTAIGEERKNSATHVQRGRRRRSGMGIGLSGLNLLFKPSTQVCPGTTVGVVSNGPFGTEQPRVD